MNKLYSITKFVCIFAAMVTISVSVMAQGEYIGNKAIDGIWGFIQVNDIGQFQHISIVNREFTFSESYAEKWLIDRKWPDDYRFEDPSPFEGDGNLSYAVDGQSKMSLDMNHLLPPLSSVIEANYIATTTVKPIWVFPPPIGDPALRAGNILSKSAYWRGSRLFAFKNDQWLLIAPNTIAYWINNKHTHVEVKPNSKNLHLPMRLGDDPFIDYMDLDTVAVSSCAYKGAIYISSNRGAIATISLGEKPAWSKAQQPFGLSETRLFSDGTALYAFTRKQKKDDWQIYRLAADDKWVETKFAKLPAARTPLYVSENYFVTSSVVRNSQTMYGQWIPQERVDICHWDKDKGWGERAITMEPQGIVMDIAENEKTHAMHILTGQEQKDTVNLSIQQTVFKFPSAEDDKIIVPPAVDEQPVVYREEVDGVPPLVDNPEEF